MLSTLDISASGLTAERIRMEITAENIANIDTTRTSDGGPYRRKLAVFQEVLDKKISQNQLIGKGVRVSHIVEDRSAPIKVYDPLHPHAAGDGFVLMPNINLADEMVDLITASRAYGANVTVLNATKAMALKALSIGKE
ncbi:MAG: flagellar basal body rod protein FlgC [Syntrophomonadaceae bacterium]|jgi:flagellar basal-body rod protein FlgC